MTAPASPRASPRGPLLVGVGTDERSDPAVLAALDLAGRLSAPVELVHAVPEGHWDGPLAQTSADHSGRLAEGRAAVAARLDLLRPTPAVVGGAPRLSQGLKVLPGAAAKVLLERARELDAGLIFLGPHRRRGFIDFGNTARALLSHASCPVWIQVEPPVRRTRIVVPVDLSEDSAAALHWACELARLLSASVAVVHCFVAPEFAYPAVPEATMPTYVVDEQRRSAREAFQRFAGDVAWAGLPHERLFFEDEPASRVLRLARSGDVIVMSTHGRGGFLATVLGSVTYAVLRESHVPVVAVRHAARPGASA